MMNWRYGATVFILWAVLMTPTSSFSQSFFRNGQAAQSHTPILPPTIEIARLLSQARSGSEVLKADGIVLYWNSTARPPERVLESLQLLLDLMVEKSEVFGPEVFSHELQVYILSYEDYVNYSYALRATYLRQHPNWQMVNDIHMTNANFLPIPQFTKNVILTYAWDWIIMLHELCHVILMRGQDVSSATNHEIVYSLQAFMMQGSEFTEFLTNATRKQ